MTQRTLPPFRADHVGSLLRTPAVLQAREDFVQGRITAAIDPMGNPVRYEYDANGDLVAVTDRENNTTRFVYNASRAHYVEQVIDPLGRTGARTEYDDRGRS